jgi:hypothetical protein
LNKTIDPGDLVASGLWDTAWNALDTHLLFDTNAHIQSPGTAVDENNDGLDPVGLGPLLPPAFPAFPAQVGLGNLFFTGGQPIFTILPYVESLDFLQVVVPSGQAALLDMIFIDSSSSGFLPYTNVEIPEPATLTLLAIGGLLMVRHRPSP